jgi:hypothetical protein
MGRDPEVMKRRVGEEKISDEGVAGFDEDVLEPTGLRCRGRGRKKVIGPVQRVMQRWCKMQ